MNLSTFDLTGKTALVTGGNGGIGLGIAIGLAKAGASVAICGRSRAKNSSAMEKLGSINPACRAFIADLRNIVAIPSFYKDISRAMNGIDILVNNAGIQRRGAAEQFTAGDIDEVMKINLSVPFIISQHFAQERIASQRGGCIIMIASLMCEASRPGTAAYTASKGAVKQLVKALAVDWAGYGIRVNGIGPGYVRTDMTRPLYENNELCVWVEKRTPLGRWGNPSDFEGVAVFLASDAAAFVTGQILYVDGGWLAAL